MAVDKKKKTLWNIIDSFEGDKVVWMIVILLILFSIVAIFSSTSLLALSEHSSRIAIVGEHMLVALGGLVMIFVCCTIPKIGLFRVVSQLGYVLSLVPLLLLVVASVTTKGETRLELGPLTVNQINDAWRSISFLGLQFHVFEFVKVAMIMYLAWAVNAFRNDSFFFANLFAEKHPVWKKPLVKKITYIYFPILSVCLCMMVGSLSSPIFIGGIMFATILIGGIKAKELIPLIGIAFGLLIACIGINSCFEASRKPFPHLDHALGRLSERNVSENLKIMAESPSGSREFQNALDAAKQPVSAKIAIKQGGLFGKGPGKSTQRYAVPIMFEDYMYSFIVEEYGLVGGIIILILYISLLARGSIIVRNCDNLFAKTAVAGLVLLITGQAMMHIMINCDLAFLTGQTLPMVSHGNSSFLMFSLAFGIILSISKIAKRKIDRETAKAEPLVNRKKNDEASGGLDDRNRTESGFSAQDDDLEATDGNAPVHENDIPDYGIDDHNNE